ncbi:MAG TPA: pyridoxal 5'-phosphate synthase glutaminase subunit PdxT [Bacillota bacterium]
MRVGVLDLQGDVSEHVESLRRCGADTARIKRIEQLDGLDGLIIPGGESTAIGKLMVKYGFMTAIPEQVRRGMGVYGTCAGLILEATEIEGSDQPRLGLLDMVAKRNAFGRQVASFEADLEIPALGPEPFRAVFIRAPYIGEVHRGVEELASVGDKIVMAAGGKHLVTAFHPELTDDPRVHRYFLERLGRA